MELGQAQPDTLPHVMPACTHAMLAHTEVHAGSGAHHGEGPLGGGLGLPLLRLLLLLRVRLLL